MCNIGSLLGVAQDFILPGSVPAFGNLAPGDNNGPVFGGSSKDEMTPAERSMVQEGEDSLNAYKVLYPETMDLARTTSQDYANIFANVYGGTIAPLAQKVSQQAQTAQRSADVQDFENLGQRTTSAILNSDPQNKAILDELNKQTLTELQSGSSLTPYQQTQIQQYARGAQANRGVGAGPADSSNEAMNLYLGGEKLAQQRKTNAAGVIQTNQNVVGDPFLAVTGRPSTSVPLGTNLSQQSGAKTPTVDPFSAYASDLNNTNFNSQWANVFNKRNNDTAQQAAMMQMIGSIVGGASGAAAAAI